MKAYKPETILSSSKFQFNFQPQIYCYVQLNQRLKLISDWVQIYQSPPQASQSSWTSSAKDKQSPQNINTAFEYVFSVELMLQAMVPMLDVW